MALVGEQLYTSSKDGTVCVWDSSTGQCTNSVPVGGEVDTLLIVEQQWLFIGMHGSTNEGVVKAWNMQTNQQMDLTGHQGAVYALATGNNMLFSGGHDTSIRVWRFDAATAGFVFASTLQAHTAGVSSLEVAENTRLLSGSMDASIKMWDLTTGQLLQSIDQAHQDVVTQMVYWESHLLSCAIDGSIKVWGASATNPGMLELKTSFPEDPNAGSPFGGGGARPTTRDGVLTMCGLLDGKQQPLLLASTITNQKFESGRLLDLPNFTERGVIFSPPDVSIRAVAYGPPGLFFTGDSLGTVKVWKFKD